MATCPTTGHPSLPSGVVCDHGQLLMLGRSSSENHQKVMEYFDQQLGHAGHMVRGHQQQALVGWLLGQREPKGPDMHC
eukprot:1142642-Pelagomonas_calceolata.AAC.13